MEEQRTPLERLIAEIDRPLWRQAAYNRLNELQSCHDRDMKHLVERTRERDQLAQKLETSQHQLQEMIAQADRHAGAAKRAELQVGLAQIVIDEARAWKAKEKFPYLVICGLAHALDKYEESIAQKRVDDRKCVKCGRPSLAGLRSDGTCIHCDLDEKD